MFLADKASDDGSGIWCSKGTIQRHTELGETTVKRTVREFLKEGILIKTGARTCKNGFTVVYPIDLTRVEALEGGLRCKCELPPKFQRQQNLEPYSFSLSRRSLPRRNGSHHAESALPKSSIKA